MKVMEDMAGQKAGALVPGSIGQLMAEAQAKGKAEGNELVLDAPSLDAVLGA